MAGTFSVSGLASGLDTASIVQQLMSLERKPIIALQNRQTRLRTVGDALRNVNTLLSTLKDKAHALQQSTTIRAHKATSSSTTILTASATSDAAVNSFTVTVERIATASSLASTGATGASNTGVALSGAGFSTAPNATGQLTVGAGTKSATIDYDASVDTINTILTKINTADAGVVASYDSTNQRLTLTAKDTGAQTITASNAGGGNLTQVFTISGATQTTGVTAQFRINGGLLQDSDSNIVTTAMPGVTLNLLTANAASPVTVTVSPDSDTISKALTDFVTAFNALVDQIATDTKYDATTKRAGTLLGDSLVNFVDMRLRNLVMSSIGLSGSITQMSDIGVTTGAVGSATGTTKHLVLDSAKLTSVLASNSDGVAQLLAGTSTVDGVMEQIETYISGMIDTGGALASRLDQNSSEITDLDKRITTLQDRLAQKQAALERRFTAMEVALAQLQQQASRLSAQLGALSGSR